MANATTIENLEKFCDMHPDTVVFAHLAARLLESKQHERALEICENGVAKHPGYPFGHFVLGLIHYSQKKYSDAKRELEFVVAQDSANPEAWHLLTEINESLNLALMTRESHLKYFLSDCFNSEVSEKFYQEDFVSTIKAPPGGGSLQESAEPEESLLEDEISEAEIESLFDNVRTPAEENESNFEETLDEVFKENFVDDDSQSAPGFDDAEDKKPAESTLESEKDAEGDEDFSNAMDSFFSEYEEKENEIELDETDDTFVEKEDLNDSFSEESDEAKIEEDSENGDEGFPVDFIEETPDENDAVPSELEEEEPIDFSSVVADIISERKDGSRQPDLDKDEEEAEGEPDAPTTAVPDLPAGADVKEETKPEPVKAAENSGGLVDIQPQKKQSTPRESREGTAHFGRPPILSPTLGEIYIAQGRFEEAIDVFNQLLDKDPDNSRYQRKLEDLKIIIKKQKERS